MRKDARQTGLRRDSNRDTLELKYRKHRRESEGELQEDRKDQQRKGQW